ncbi:MAG: uridine kinase [Candidatus Nanopelagicales bacterium]
MATEPCADGSADRRRVILLAGPSGSGKSTLVRAVGLPMVFLDDFYRPGSDPNLPRHPELGIVDWDDPLSWDDRGAFDALRTLCRTGACEVPMYDFAADGPRGTRMVQVGTGPFVAEGIFAPQLVGMLRSAGLLLDAIVIVRDPWKNLVRRAARDLRERRKPPGTILRRGWQLYGREPDIVAAAVAAGARPRSAAQTRAALHAYAEAYAGADSGRPRR